ncbi:MAG: 4-(cytidine 5'-diphospho)-2-C-methyl-D-erythritol kinase [Bacteroidales bacterium]|nr:4-(cytidine 5'-diphospho)-2-C-methyl-D-erythritol kinase [Bacteroidales bacterium]
MILRTNVKLNFGLNVIRKRPDGYHDIETLFVPCHEFGDTLEVITGDDYSRTSASLFGRYGSVAQGISEDGKLMISIAKDEGIDWDPLKDLCAKAYYLLAEDFKLPPVKIFLEKTAPVGAGLGGGSADAAFTLKALNEICALGLSEERLSEYASRLGSDCAFFIWNRPMFGTGRGEILEPFDLDLSGYEVKVLVPEGISVSTKEAYDGIIPRSSVEGPIVPLMDLKEALMQPVEEWKGLVVNDFETTVFKKHPELAAIKQSLYDSGAVYAAMSGSGSAVFALYRK